VSELVNFLRAHDMGVPPDLHDAVARDVMVLVDDDRTYLEALSRLIEKADLGLDVVKVTNGVDALIAIGRVRPVLVALDYRLPDLNALQIIERLLEPGRKLAAELLVITGGIEVEDQERLHKLGVRAILNKADGASAVIDAIRQALGRRKAA
jgi:CheY-like chemotaxis protein